jgi:hypothetical protein
MREWREDPYDGIWVMGPVTAIAVVLCIGVFVPDDVGLPILKFMFFTICAGGIIALIYWFICGWIVAIQHYRRYK